MPMGGGGESEEYFSENNNLYKSLSFGKHKKTEKDNNFISPTKITLG